MKEKGFTLIELIASIVLLGIIALIVFPEVNNTINNSKEKAYNTQIESLINSTKSLAAKHTELLPDIGSDEIVCITPTILMNYGEIETDNIVDPRDKSKLKGFVLISYNIEYNQYVYEFSLSCPNE